MRRHVLCGVSDMCSVTSVCKGRGMEAESGGVGWEVEAEADSEADMLIRWAEKALGVASLKWVSEGSG